MNSPLTRADHLRLLERHQPPCVSIYVPMERAHPASQQNPIRFRNRVKEAEEILAREQKSAGRGLVDRLRRLDDETTWSGQREGLAVFASPDLFLSIRLPLKVPELTVVAETFHTRPLLPYLGSRASYYLLAVAQKHVALYEGWRETLDRVEVPGMPGQLEDVVGELEFGPSLTSHTVKPGVGGAIFHGTGERRPDMKAELKKFFRAVDEKASRHLGDLHRPVVLAAQVHHQPVYRAASTLKTLLPEGVICDPEHTAASELGKRAWEEVKTWERKGLRAICERYEEAQSKKRGSADLLQVARSAAAGRVEVLLIEEGRPVWGRLDRASGEVAAGEAEKNARDADVMDDLAELVLERHGEVVLIEGDSFPTPTGVAAIFRY